MDSKGSFSKWPLWKQTKQGELRQDTQGSSSLEERETCDRKGLTKGSAIVPTTELVRSVPKLNFSTSILTEKTTEMDITRKIPKQEELHEESTFFKPDVCIRGKKRRLDHLTWEEKLQRKKLKNRVAAQTSRDRKKAKLDELEETVKTLKERNDVLTQECALLKSQNESLISSCRLSCTFTGICSIPTKPSAAGWDSTVGIVPDANTRSSHIAEDYDPLPPLEELFGDIQGDDYIDRLEELAESLLREVTAEVEANSHRSNEQVSDEENTVKKSDNSKRMVGQTSKNVEADTIAGRSVNDYDTWHLNCSADVTHVVLDNTQTTPVSIKNEIEIKQEPDLNDMETVYGTYDEITNSITIIYPGQEDNVGIQECVQEISSDNVSHTDDVTLLTTHHSYSDQFSPAYTCTDIMSPSSIYSDNVDASSSIKSDSHFSDGGYESHNSPSADVHNKKDNSSSSNKNNKNNNNNVCLTDLWHESFTELFPMLA
ncbi:hypothetical protein HZH66_004098 [Vespula vulgaris]|uniref:X-box-binding protein 1 n=1 Tax=Vespula vulgaris TaxID=7454 RepID=A0A834KFX0_VESVU|nr:hypothetical protein HZH66_004098 [Vespula vulgaris]